MKNLLLSLLICVNFNLFAQVISFEKIASFSVDSLNGIIASEGLPEGLIVPLYDVDYYKVLYLSPYLHLDSLVQASGAIAIPNVPDCDLPLGAYGHGTQTKKSKVASELNGGQWEVNTIMASTGYAIAMPDYLGLGDADPNIPIPPYSHNDSESMVMINILRAARTITDSLGIGLNGQIFLYGYSQGGAATAATVKEIEENYASEFNITASAPMSGAYDFKDAQVDLISSTDVYPTPAYFPYIILAYQSIYNNLFNDPSDFFASPYDTLLPPIFYEGNTGVGNLNDLCAPVPRDMLIDSVMEAFLSDSTHPMRLNLLDNDLVRGWAPQSPMKILYCNGDDQVSFLNSENAYDAWNTAGSPSLEKMDLGGFNHNVCASFAFLETKRYFDELSNRCATSIDFAKETKEPIIYPNPFSYELKSNEEGILSIYNQLGQKVLEKELSVSEAVNTEELLPGIYFYELNGKNLGVHHGTLIK